MPEANPDRPETLKVLGLQHHRVGVEEIHRFIGRTIRLGGKALILNLNIHCVNLALRNPWLKEFMNQAALVFCDGDGVRWGLKILGEDPPPKITYDRWIWQLAEFCSREGYRIFFLGAKPGTAAEAARPLQARFPKLQIAGTHHGYFEKTGAENERVIEEVNHARADILVVGFGMPLQEKWLSENWRKINACVFLNGGAVFDYASGALKRAPAWMIQAHLEWLYRFFQDPKRLFIRYALGNPYFFYRIFLEKMTRKP